MFRCSYCMSPTEQILDLGFLPPVNVMSRIDENISINTSYPLGISICQSCGLTQIINEIESALVFPESYPYLSGTTKILVENFSAQAQEIFLRFISFLIKVLQLKFFKYTVRPLS